MKISQVCHWLGAVLCIAGCASKMDEGTSGSAAMSDESVHGALPTEFTIFPDKIWTGFDGANTYRAPIIAVSNKGEVKWTIDDPSIATLDTNSADPKAKGGGVNMMLTAT